MTQQATGTGAAAEKSRWITWKAFLRLFQPLARIAMRHRTPLQVMVHAMKLVMVDAGQQELTPNNGRQSISRIAMLTGMSRSEVREMIAELNRARLPSFSAHLKPMAVVEAWRRDPAFQDDDGEPMTLPAKGPHPSFESLVRNYGGDVPPKTLRDELESAGTLERLSGERVRLIRRAYVPPESQRPERMQVVAQSAARLLNTGLTNVQREDTGEERLFQRQFEGNALPPSLIPALHQDLQEMLERYMDEAAARIERDEEDEEIEGYHVTAGIGMYYFEER